MERKKENGRKSLVEKKMWGFERNLGAYFLNKNGVTDSRK